MKVNVYSILDSKTGIYSHPMFLQSDGAMMRAWVDHVNDPRNAISQHPEDYILFKIGQFDDERASFEQHPPQSMGLAIEVKRQNAAVREVPTVA